MAQIYENISNSKENGCSKRLFLLKSTSLEQPDQIDRNTITIDAKANALFSHVRVEV